MTCPLRWLVERDANLAILPFVRKMIRMSSREQAPSTISRKVLRFDRARLLLLIGLSVLTIGALVALAGGRSALDALTHANWPLVALAVAIHYGGFAIRGHRWQRLLNMVGHELGYLYTTGLLLAGWFVSALLPARSGDLVRIGVLRLDRTRHAPVPVADSLSSIVLERALDMLAILLLGAGFGFIVLRDQLPSWLLTSYAVGLILLCGFGVALLAMPPLLGWMRKITAHRYWQALMGFAERFVDDLRTLFRRPATAFLVGVESLVIWLCDVLVVWLVLLSLGDAVGLAAAGFVALTVDVLAAIPLTPGGVGQIDVAYASFFALLTVTTLNVGVAVLIVRIITYWSFLLFAGLVTVIAGFGKLFQEMGLPDDAETGASALDI